MGSTSVFSVLSTISSLLTFIRTTSPASSDQENRGLEEDLNQLEKMLRRIRATLHDAREREIREESVKLWLRELKDVAFDAEDVLDEYRYEILRRQAEAREKKPLEFEKKELDVIAKRIREIKMQFEVISRDREALRLREEDGERPSTYGVASSSVTSHMFDESTMFGRGLDMEKILGLVNDAGDQLMVIPIIGMGGIGKTTMAQMVYNNSVVEENFDLRVWVHVSPSFDVMKITRDILESVSGSAYSGPTGLSAAQTVLKELVKGHRLFLVLDDVWNQKRNPWELFLQPLRAAKIVKIIVTARNKHVTEIVQTADVHLLGRLPEHESWLLFKHYAFGIHGTVENSSLTQIGKEIVTKCGGLPLAVKTIGGLLSYTMDEYSWRDILVSELWESDGKDEIFPALKVSYYSLPPELKPCFLYCSLFPRGFSFDKDQLIHMWMAQGYVCPMGGKRPEDIGDSYFSELCMRSFIQSDMEGSFRLHDLIHDLARAISTGEIFTISRGNVCNTPTEVRHVCIMRRDSHYQFSKPSLLRTLNWEVHDHNFHNSSHNIHECIRLRVLVIQCRSVSSLGYLPGLKHLRYLSIAHCKLERLPDSICLLFYLETLELRYFTQLNELPVDIGKLFNLRHLFILGAAIRKLPESMFELDKLQTLIVQNCLIEELSVGLGNLVSLRSLTFCYNRIKSVPRTICNLSNLQLLDLRGNLSFLEWLCDTRELLDRRSLEIWVSIVSFPIFPRKLELRRPGLTCISGRFSIRSPDLKNFQKYFMRLINQNRVDDYVSWRYKQIWYGDVKYRKTESLLESLEPHNDLIELSINGYKGVAYPKWRNIPVVSKNLMFILMKCYVEDGTFLPLLCQLRSLKYLRLRGITNIKVLGHASSQPYYGESATPLCTKMPFRALQELEFKDMLEWENWGVIEGDFPKLKVLTLKNCPKLRRLPNFSSLVKLEVRRCGITELNLDQPGLEDIHIEDCTQLTSLLGLQNLSSKQTLYIARCPLLVFSLNQGLLPKSINLEIVDCPGLKEWCQSKSCSHVYKQVSSCKSLIISDNRRLMEYGPQNCSYVYKQVSSCKSLIISDIKRLVKYGPQNFCSLAHLCIEGAELSDKMFGSTINLFPSTLVSLHLISCNFSDLRISPNLCKLRRLEIRSCLKLKFLGGLHKLSLLSCLILCDCPLLRIRSETMLDETYPEMTEEGQEPNMLAEEEEEEEEEEEDKKFRRKKEGQLPPKLESLVIHGCHSMLSLHLIFDNPLAVSELQIMNCSRLMYIEGLGDLINLETMAFVDCPQLLLELLKSVPECVVISGCPRLKYWCEVHAVEPLDDQPQDGDNRDFTNTADLAIERGAFPERDLKRLKRMIPPCDRDDAAADDEQHGGASGWSGGDFYDAAHGSAA